MDAGVALFSEGNQHHGEKSAFVGLDPDGIGGRGHCRERRRIVTLLPDREIAIVEAWLADHPQIEIVSRDRGGGYGEATARALPNAVQVADRWHLMENAKSQLRADRAFVRAMS